MEVRLSRLSLTRCGRLALIAQIAEASEVMAAIPALMNHRPTFSAFAAGVAVPWVGPLARDAFLASRRAAVGLRGRPVRIRECPCGRLTLYTAYTAGIFCNRGKLSLVFRDRQRVVRLRLACAAIGCFGCEARFAEVHITLLTAVHTRAGHNLLVANIAAEPGRGRIALKDMLAVYAFRSVIMVQIGDVVCGHRSERPTSVPGRRSRWNGAAYRQQGPSP